MNHANATLRLAITSAYPQLTLLAKELAEEMGVSLIVVDAVMEEAATLISDLAAKNGVDAIISRGATARTVERAVDIPVIKAEASPFDLLKALNEARDFARVGLFTHHEYRDLYEHDDLCQMCGRPFREYHYGTAEDLVRQIHRAKDDDISAVLMGSVFGLHIARDLNMHGILVCTSRKTLQQAFVSAIWIARLLRADRIRSHHLKTILDLSSDGILAVDTEQRVLFINPRARHLLGLSGSMTVERLPDVFPLQSDLQAVVQMEATAGEPLELKGRYFIVNKALARVCDCETSTVYTFADVSHVQQAESRVRSKRVADGLTAKYTFADIVGDSPAMRQVLEYARRVSSTESTVLITGESGTGKELFAHSIHMASSRVGQPFIAVNCAALPETLLESELFGYEEGGFTGARKGGKPGFFELAHGGTLVLDEIGVLPKSAQLRLLRVLQEREVVRLGGGKVIPINVRIIACTNESLRQLVCSHHFRADLYYRISVLNLVLPPLRHREGDVERLFDHFLQLHARAVRRTFKGFSPEALTWARGYAWPGNVRELSNYVEQMVLLSEGDFIGLRPAFMEGFEEDLGDHGGEREGLVVERGSLECMTDALIAQLYAECGGKTSKLAEELGISRSTLWKRLKQASWYQAAAESRA